jgi:hypothetical protein
MPAQIAQIPGRLHTFGDMKHQVDKSYGGHQKPDHTRFTKAANRELSQTASDVN